MIAWYKEDALIIIEMRICFDLPSIALLNSTFARLVCILSNDIEFTSITVIPSHYLCCTYDDNVYQYDFDRTCVYSYYCTLW